VVEEGEVKEVEEVEERAVFAISKSTVGAAPAVYQTIGWERGRRAKGTCVLVCDRLDCFGKERLLGS